jgi:peptidoglycan/xylan/chitin deacetylase (PgdA/CDA1 family)
MLTFDDGYKDNYTILYPLLQKYNLKATIFVVTETVWSKNRVSREDIAEMSASGLVSIQSHTKSHSSLPSLGNKELVNELALSKEYLEELTGKPVIALCYPEGAQNAAVRTAAAEHYSYAVLNYGGTYTCGNNPMTMSRIRVSRGMGIKGFASLLN